ncbi:MAG TPA: hypothetical protein VFB89_07890 [Gemmatimonadales bacterium]|nr:hypothetical protein [Gemmatimonadales bacterium]
MGELVPIAGMFTGLLITIAGVWGIVQIIQGPLGQALARRIQGRTGDADLQNEVADLKDQIDGVRRQLEETQERLDFAERLLSQRPTTARIPGGDESGSA